ncbi:MAG: IS3 family transposase [Leeuwenhoekiella sp.]
MSRRKYTAQYKEKAIALSEEKGNVAAAARELGIVPPMIHRWKKEKEQYSHNSFPGYGKPKMTDQEREIDRLEKALKDARLETEIFKKGHQHLLQERQERFRFMKQHKLKYPVEKMCKLLDVSSSGYYHWLKNGPSNRWLENENIISIIEKVFEESYQSYGAPRMAVELEKRGFKVSRPRTGRMMKGLGIKARRRRKFKATTDSNHNYPIAPNLLNRNFSTSRKNQVWVSDITYIETSNGWAYLTVIIDLFDRKVIGWSVSQNMTAESTVIRAWYMAVGNRSIKAELIFHSDRGSQYACETFRNILKSYKLIKQSMSRKGNCWDNAVAESFFKSLKTEWVYKNNYNHFSDAELSIFKWIETWYNRNRRHSALNYKTINEFELEINNHKLAA